MNIYIIDFYRNNATIINIYRNRYKLKTDNRLDETCQIYDSEL